MQINGGTEGKTQAQMRVVQQQQQQQKQKHHINSTVRQQRRGPLWLSNQ
jgi:hypothetical protein